VFFPYLTPPRVFSLVMCQCSQTVCGDSFNAGLIFPACDLYLGVPFAFFPPLALNDYLSDAMLPLPQRQSVCV